MLASSVLERWIGLGPRWHCAWVNGALLVLRAGATVNPISPIRSEKKAEGTVQDIINSQRTNRGLNDK